MATSNTDAPTAVVPVIGPTEIVALLVTIGGLLASLFGQDWGISEHAEQVVSSGYIIGPAVIGFARAIKHHGAAHANAAVYIAQLAAAAEALAHPAQSVTPEAVAAGVATLNAATPNPEGEPPAPEGDAAP